MHGMHFYFTAITIKLLPCGNILLLPCMLSRFCPYTNHSVMCIRFPHDCSLFLQSSNHQTINENVELPIHQPQCDVHTISPWSGIVFLQSSDHQTINEKVKLPTHQPQCAGHTVPHDQALFPSIIGPPDHQWKHQTANTPTTVCDLHMIPPWLFLVPPIIGPPDHQWKRRTANTPTTVWCAYDFFPMIGHCFLQL